MPVKNWANYKCRVTFQRLELTSLHIFQAHCIDRVYQGVPLSCFWVQCQALQREGEWVICLSYLDTSDTKSTSNLCKHAKICFGDEEVASADKWDVHAACEVLKNRKDRSITEAFKCVAKSKVTYSHCQHTTIESWCVSIPHCSRTNLTWNDRAKIVHWIAKSKQPFQIVNDCGFQSLMKTGRHEYHIPSIQTVSCDVKWVFVQVHKCIANSVWKLG